MTPQKPDERDPKQIAEERSIWETTHAIWQIGNRLTGHDTKKDEIFALVKAAMEAERGDIEIIEDWQKLNTYANSITPGCHSVYEVLDEIPKLRDERASLNTPEIEYFDKALPLESAHQIKRWGVEHDAGKTPEDWFWLIGYLAGKALHAAKSGDSDKAKHHCISTAAALRNWHRAIRQGFSEMRPGIEPPR